MNRNKFFALLLAAIALLLFQQYRITVLQAERSDWQAKVLALQDVHLGDSLLIVGDWIAARAHGQDADPTTRARWLANVDAAEQADTEKKSKELAALKSLSVQAAKLEQVQKNEEQLRERIDYLRKKMRSLRDSAEMRAWDFSHMVQQRDSLLQDKELVLAQMADQLQQLSTEVQNKTVLRLKSPAGVDILYFGQTDDGKPHGHGLGFYANGTKYEGDWENGDKHGRGTYTYPNGERYEGAFNRNKREGLGTYTWPNGDTYRGYWKDDKREGEGAIKNAKGQVLRSGLWKNDKLAEGRAVDLK